MENYYDILGLSSAATSDELRRAYRILARRYHPDVNPGEKSAERFKKIAEAYAVLQDPAKRRAHDAELDRLSAEQFTSSFDRAHQAYRKQQTFEEVFAKAEEKNRTRSQAHTRSRRASETASGATKSDATRAGSANTYSYSTTVKNTTTTRAADKVRAFFTSSSRLAKTIQDRIPKFRITPSRLTKESSDGSTQPSPAGNKVTQVSILEVSISVLDAIKGLRKTVEIQEETTTRKISVIIPPGVRSGSVIRFRRREVGDEEIVILIRVASHPALSISSKGLVLEVPITVKEAVMGARIKVPTLEEPSTVFIEPGTQSGTEIRLRGQGILYRDGSKGDLFIRVLIRVPSTLGAVGLEDRCNELEQYYERAVRDTLPKSILEM